MAAGLAAAVLLPSDARAAADYRWEPVVPQPDAPITFADEYGGAHDLSRYRGRPLLLNLWATWCGPCLVELPALDRLQRDLGGAGLTVMALSLDRGGVRDVRLAHRRLRLKRLAPLVDVSGNAARVLHVPGLPVTFAVDADGRFVGRRRGAVAWDEPEERRRVGQLLLGGSSGAGSFGQSHFGSKIP